MGTSDGLPQHHTHVVEGTRVTALCCSKRVTKARLGTAGAVDLVQRQPKVRVHGSRQPLLQPGSFIYSN